MQFIDCVYTLYFPRQSFLSIVQNEEGGKKRTFRPTSAKTNTNEADIGSQPDDDVERDEKKPVGGTTE